MIKKVLLLIFVLVECADAVTTNIILSHGGGELNPFMVYAQTSLGNLWVIPKMGLAYVVLWFLSRGKKPLHIAAVCGTTVVNNLLAIAAMN